MTKPVRALNLQTKEVYHVRYSRPPPMQRRRYSVDRHWRHLVHHKCRHTHGNARLCRSLMLWRSPACVGTQVPDVLHFGISIYRCDAFVYIAHNLFNELLMVGLIIITFMVCVVLWFFGLEFIDAMNSQADSSERMIVIFLFICLVLTIYVDACRTVSSSMTQSGL